MTIWTKPYRCGTSTVGRSLNGYFFIPTYGSLIAAINFDLSGTTRIGKYVINHSFMVPGLVATSVAVVTGLALARVVF